MDGGPDGKGVLADEDGEWRLVPSGRHRRGGADDRNECLREDCTMCELHRHCLRGAAAGGNGGEG